MSQAIKTKSIHKEKLIKAILACTFHGEFSTNDPKEESAEELLKEIFSKK